MRRYRRSTGPSLSLDDPVSDGELGRVLELVLGVLTDQEEDRPGVGHA
jgi:hypothetical protein